MAIKPISDAAGNLTLLQGQSYNLAFSQTFTNDGGATTEPVDLTGAILRFSIKVPGTPKPKLTFTSVDPAEDPAGSHPYDPALPPLTSNIIFTDIENGKYTVHVTAYQTARLLVSDYYIYEVERIMPDGEIRSHVLASLAIDEQAGAR